MCARMPQSTHHSVDVNEGEGATGVVVGSTSSRAGEERSRPAAGQTVVGVQCTNREESTHRAVPEQRPMEKEVVADVGRQARLVDRSILPLERERNGEVAGAGRLPQL